MQSQNFGCVLLSVSESETTNHQRVQVKVDEILKMKVLLTSYCVYGCHVLLTNNFSFFLGTDLIMLWWNSSGTVCLCINTFLMRNILQKVPTVRYCRCRN